jgi:hypothetical protein
MSVERRVVLNHRGRMAKSWLWRGVAFAAMWFCVSVSIAAADAVTALEPLFSQPYIDADEWRDAPVRHRYVHGGFKGTDTRFSFYLPAKEQYQGRFFQHLTPFPLSEKLAQQDPVGEFNKIGFAIASGAYFVETNGGSTLPIGKVATTKSDPTITAYRANAAAAQYSRVVAMQMYGSKRPYGYAYGGSGGAYRTVGSIENTKGVWDGAVPYVLGSSMAIPNMFTVRMHAMRILKGKFPQIVDAVEPGGSGDPFLGLNALQVSALREITRMGFPLKSWYGYNNMGVHGFAALYPGIVAADPTYFVDFWTKPGYLGFDHPDQFTGARMQFKTSLAAPMTAAEAARLRINLDASSAESQGGVDSAFRIPEGAEGARVAALRLKLTPPPIDFIGGDLIVMSGAAKNKRLPLARIVGDIAVLGVADQDVANLLAANDEVQIDNSNFLAAQTYHRHQVPGPEYKVWDQFRRPDGKPMYPQRPMLLGPVFTQATAGSLPTGAFEGKIILVESLWDREALPWSADWYRGLVQKHFGDASDDHFRLWYTDHALHGDEGQLEDATHVVSYNGILHQALRDLSAWVEKGIAPPASTSYRVDDGQVIVPPTAEERRGVQPVVRVQANAAARSDVAVGEPVTFTGTIAVPPGTGSIIAAQWDFDGAGTFPVSSNVSKGAKATTVSITRAFDKPGTYFPVLRGISQREGDTLSPYARIQNLGRVRVVVR